MIKSFKSKELEKFFLTGNRSKINQAHLKKIRRMLAVLNTASILEDINFPGWRLHKLEGNLKEYYAIMVSGNYRIIFKFKSGDVYEVDYLDYH